MTRKKKVLEKEDLHGLEDSFLISSEACKILRVSRQYLSQLRRSGKLKYHDLGYKTKRYYIPDFMKFLVQREINKQDE